MLVKSIFGFCFSVVCNFFNFVVGVVHIILGGAAAGIAFYLGRVLDRLVAEDVAAVKKIREVILEFQRYLQANPKWHIKEIRDHSDRLQTLKEGLMFRYCLLDFSILKINAYIDGVEAFKIGEILFIDSTENNRETFNPCLRMHMSSFWDIDQKGRSLRLDAMSAYFYTCFIVRAMLCIRYHISKLLRRPLKDSLYCTCLKRSRKCKCRKVSEEALNWNPENILANKDCGPSSVETILVRDISSFDKELGIENCSSDCATDRIVT